MLRAAEVRVKLPEAQAADLPEPVAGREAKKKRSAKISKKIQGKDEPPAEPEGDQ
jgi:hypothetical protein